MGLLIDGQWHDRWYASRDGKFEREQAKRRHWVTPDGAPGPDGQSGSKAEAGRYHLYVSLACPWAHRTLIYRKLKGLEPLIDVSVVSWLMAEHGWTFDKPTGSSGDALDDFDYLHQRYTRDDPKYSGRVTVPVLWDRERQCIVNNESAEIIRIFNDAFDELTGSTLDFYPEALHGEIDALNARIYPAINNGVYRAGFATTQEAYEEAFDELFRELDWLERRLGKQRYLTGEYLTEADWRLFTTVIRFDAVYHGHFKCNLRCIEDYPNLSNWLRELYQWPGIAETVDFTHIKNHYYTSHRQINANGIVPKGPLLGLDRPHDRERLRGNGIWVRSEHS
ncbi:MULTISPECIES: glutathione S-transferase family protein [Stutzerimonas stutzeri subgroup]|jgi:putative glutathione S-transferase|uniref:Glutathione S-transferase domain-containing protein n=1 Tax=Stutzerimonas stutzeri NF13 TaxID=1212548 RepID=M2VKM4_STUST|nr:MULTISPECIES: glutathione S-transferase family protein [Stutzerimonas stutzeri subgroup]EME00533.1 glutathione S-transferase domain-containing protein [Stutzerimonas stutzeri NF13]MBK3883052.1 glutathione S-transferase family protein [Stutzerimonas stutzeri]WOF79454.1 glutathione S-transferase family protein [Pseudomonas sp. FeN3W]